MGYFIYLLSEGDYDDYMSLDDYDMTQALHIGYVSSNFREYADEKYDYPWSIYNFSDKTVLENKKLLISTISKLYDENITAWIPDKDKSKDSWTVDKSVYLYHLNNIYNLLSGHDDDLMVVLE